MTQSSAKGGTRKQQPGNSSSKPRGDGDIFLEIHRIDQRYGTLRFLLFLPSLAIPILAGIPIAKTFAGTQTSLNVTLTATLGVTMVGIMGLATLIINNQRKTISELRRDNAVLRGGLVPPGTSPSPAKPKKPNQS